MPREPIKLTFWNYWDGKNGEVMQALVDRYNAEHPDVEIENVFVGWGELLPKLQLAVAGGDTPDPRRRRHGLDALPGQFRRAGPTQQLRRASGTDIADFYPALLAVNTYGDQYYGLPVSTNNLGCSSTATCSRRPGSIRCPADDLGRASGHGRAVRQS